MSTTVRKMFWGITHLKPPLQNGMGRYVQQLQRITFKFCKSWCTSSGIRQFIEKDLIQFAKENPGVVVYVKPRRHRSPCLKAEYLNGEEDYISAHNLPREDVAKWVEFLRTKSETTKLLLKLQHTTHPSIQGNWTPFVHKNPALNVANFPDPNLSLYPVLEKSGTEELLEIFQRQTEEKEIDKQIKNV